MNEQADPQERIRHTWQAILDPLRDILEPHILPTDRSALYASIPDCYESMQRICDELLPALARTARTDYATLHDLLFDIGGATGELEHIRGHIAAAQGAFDVLLKALARKADDPRAPDPEEAK
jgi:hypothetical protein